MQRIHEINILIISDENLGKLFEKRIIELDERSYNHDNIQDNTDENSSLLTYHRKKFLINLIDEIPEKKISPKINIGVILFSLSSKKSLDNLKHHAERLKSIGIENCLLLGNNNDNSDGEVLVSNLYLDDIIYEISLIIQNLDLNIRYLEIDLETGKNIKKTLEIIINTFCLDNNINPKIADNSHGKYCIII